MEFRDFEIEQQDNNTIVVRQSDHNGGYDSLFLDVEQVGFFVAQLLKFSNKKVSTEYSATINIQNDDDSEYDSTIISSSTLNGLENAKQYFFDAFVYNFEFNPYRRNDLTMSNIKKQIVIDITEEF